MVIGEGSTSAITELDITALKAVGIELVKLATDTDTS